MFWLFLKVVGFILVAVIAIFVLAVVVNVLWTVYKAFFTVPKRPKAKAVPVDPRQVRDVEYEVIK